MSNAIIATRLFVLFLLVPFLLPSAGWSDAKTIREWDNNNQGLLATPWTTLLPGQPGGYGFTLRNNGQLIFQGNPIKPLIRVQNNDGKSQLAPISVNISPLSPSKRFALLTACEPPAEGSSFCWFQYLLDLKQNRLIDLSWAKYPTPTTVWWEAHERYAVLPISEEGEVWLSVVDLAKKESRDIHFEELAQESARALQCTLPEQEGYTVDLSSFKWLDQLQISITLQLACGGEKTRSVKTVLDLASGQLKRVLESKK